MKEIYKNVSIEVIITTKVANVNNFSYDELKESLIKNIDDLGSEQKQKIIAYLPEFLRQKEIDERDWDAFTIYCNTGKFPGGVCH